MFGKSNRRSDTLPAYDPRSFITTDARQNAFDDYMVPLLSQSGLAGLMPLWGMVAAEAPSGFDYTTNLIGLGGTPVPVNALMPLVTQPQWAQTYIAEATGQDRGLY